MNIVQTARAQGCTKVSQYITAKGGKFFEISFDMIIENKSNETLIRYTDQKNSLFQKWVHIAETERAQGHTNNDTLRSIKRFF